MKRRPVAFNIAACLALAISLACAGCVTHTAPYDGFDANDPNAALTGPNGDPSLPPPVSRYAARNGTALPAGISRYRRDDEAPSAADAEAAAANAATLKKLMAELESLGPVDSETQARLAADFEQTDPALWPMLMQTFRAGMAYRQGRSAVGATAQINDAGRSRPASSIELTSATADAADHSGQASYMPGRAASTAPAAAAKPLAPGASAGVTSPPQSSIPQTPAFDPTGQLPLSALQVSMPGNSGGASSLPTQALLAAALAEAQRKAAESQAVSPPAVATAPNAIQDPFAAPAPPPKAAAAEAPSGGATSAAPSADRASNNAAGNTPNNASVAGTWQDRLNEAIAKLEPLTREPPKDAADVSRHAWLRMLYLTAGRRDDALKPIAGIPAAEQDYWSEQLYALATTLDVERTPDAAQRSAEARRHLAKAETRLAENGLLAVRNLAFCTEVSSYGVYQKFAESTFKANQPLILYAEVDNFKSEETAKGFHTSLRSSYQIIDGQGRRVAENDLAITEEYCRNRRRDYFIRYFLSVPERIYEGKYTLQLTIVDTLSQKIGQASIDFTVGDAK